MEKRLEHLSIKNVPDECLWWDALTAVYWNEFSQHSSWCEQPINFMLKKFMSVKIADKKLKYCLFVSLIQMFF